MSEKSLEKYMKMDLAELLMLSPEESTDEVLEMTRQRFLSEVQDEKKDDIDYRDFLIKSDSWYREHKDEY